MKLASILPVALIASALLAPVAAKATPITFSATAAAAVSITPSSDIITLDAASATEALPGIVLLQTGNILIGDSEIADQIIPFSFLDAVSINGITRLIAISGQDNVTTGPDIITFFSGDPVSFGDVTFQLNSSTYTGDGSIGQNIPVTLTADLAQTPEPASFAFLGTGLIGAAKLMYSRRRVAA